MRQGKHKNRPEHLAGPGSKEAPQVTGHAERTQKPVGRSAHWPNLGEWSVKISNDST